MMSVVCRGYTCVVGTRVSWVYNTNKQTSCTMDYVYNRMNPTHSKGQEDNVTAECRKNKGYYCQTCQKCDTDLGVDSMLARIHKRTPSEQDLLPTDLRQIDKVDLRKHRIENRKVKPKTPKDDRSRRRVHELTNVGHRETVDKECPNTSYYCTICQTCTPEGPWTPFELSSEHYHRTLDTSHKQAAEESCTEGSYCEACQKCTKCNLIRFQTCRKDAKEAHTGGEDYINLTNDHTLSTSQLGRRWHAEQEEHAALRCTNCEERRQPASSSYKTPYILKAPNTEHKCRKFTGPRDEVPDFVYRFT
jgi:hypothetical protein